VAKAIKKPDQKKRPDRWGSFNKAASIERLVRMTFVADIWLLVHEGILRARNHGGNCGESASNALGLSFGRETALTDPN
jgi:hypothetical protein